MKIIYLSWMLLGLSLAALAIRRLLDWQADRVEWSRMAMQQPVEPARFDPAMIAGLPEPAQRYFRFVIAPGSPLLPVAEIDMGGWFSLGTREKPDCRSMEAHQILAAPHGFVWQMRMPGVIPVSGSDSGSWTRFRIFGLIPVARMGGNLNHARASFGRYVAEAVFWTPAALLPGPDVTWQEVDQNTARVTVTKGSLSQAVDVVVNTEGQPLTVSFLRWSNANAEKQYRLQPFGGVLSDFREVKGYRLPFKVEAGNMFGTDDCFVFYKAEVQAIRFPGVGQ